MARPSGIGPRPKISVRRNEPANTTATRIAKLWKRVVISSAPVEPCSVRNPIMKKNRPNATSAGQRGVLQRGGEAEAFGDGGSGVTDTAHTFSTSGRPRMPVGRKISTTIRIEKAATSLYSIEK